MNENKACDHIIGVAFRSMKEDKKLITLYYYDSLKKMSKHEPIGFVICSQFDFCPICGDSIRVKMDTEGFLNPIQNGIY